MTAPARHPGEGRDPRQATGNDLSAPLVTAHAAILDAASNTALIRVTDAFRSMMTFSGVCFCPNAVRALVRDGLLYWRIEGEIAELTHAGKTRAALTRARQRNAAQMRALNLSLQRKDHP